MVNNNLVGGWALPLWKMMDFVSWDDEIPNMMGKIKAMFQTTNQNISGPINESHSMRSRNCSRAQKSGHPRVVEEGLQRFLPLA